jgi:hypothetical protein
MQRRHELYKNDRRQWEAQSRLCYTASMSQTLVRTVAIVALLLGGIGLGWFITSQPPFLSDRSLNQAAVVGVLVTLLLAATGVATLVAQELHRRFPTLAGRPAGSRTVGPSGAAAIRQGLLFAAIVLLTAVLALLGRFDVTFVIVALVLVTLVIQSRS